MIEAIIFAFLALWIAGTLDDDEDKDNQDDEEEWRSMRPAWN